MADDDLTAPLGLAPRKKGGAPMGRRLIGGGILVVGLAVVLVAWALLVRDPGGEAPVAVATVDAKPPAAKTETTGAIRSTASPAPSSTASNSPASLTEVAPDGGLSDVAGEVVIHDPSAPGSIQLAVAPVDDLVETGPYGPLPRVGADGRRPLDAYARPYDAGPGHPPRIAIVVGGVGIAEGGTEAAIDLPGAVTLAFAPYGKDLARDLRRARVAGHEILLQIPLEPYGYPKNDPGPKTLTLAATDGENLDRLHWFMSRITTYVGVVNYLGARFTGDADKLKPVMDEIGSRGLLYLDDGSSVQSRADQLAPGVVPFGRADVVLDPVTEAAPIDARLQQLVAIAKERGYAIGAASAFPVTIERVAAFAKAAADRGIDIVPVTALIQTGRT
jgi:polysaccharide deacetylase 2 family uncharacterized protein YibQ